MICMCPRVRSPRSLSRRFGIVGCIPDTDLSGCISYRCQRRQYAGQRIGIRTPNIRYAYTAITSTAIDRTEPRHVARTGAVGGI
jgi:hypothetical protein